MFEGDLAVVGIGQDQLLSGSYGVAFEPVERSEPGGRGAVAEGYFGEGVAAPDQVDGRIGGGLQANFLSGPYGVGPQVVQKAQLGHGNVMAEGDSGEGVAAPNHVPCFPTALGPQLQPLAGEDAVGAQLVPLAHLFLGDAVAKGDSREGVAAPDQVDDRLGSAVGAGELRQTSAEKNECQNAVEPGHGRGTKRFKGNGRGIKGVG